MGSDQVKSSKVDLLTAKHTYSTMPIYLHESYLLNVLKSGEVFPDIRILETSWPVGPPLVISLGEGLWELRSNLDNKIARVLFMVHNDQIVLLQGFIKKSKKTPKKEMDLARKRKSLFKKG